MASFIAGRYFSGSALNEAAHFPQQNFTCVPSKVLSFMPSRTTTVASFPSFSPETGQVSSGYASPEKVAGPAAVMASPAEVASAAKASASRVRMF